MLRPGRRAADRGRTAGGTPIRLPTGLAAWTWGTGPAVLLVHGWEGRSSQLDGFVGPIVAAGLRCVAIDAPAHGDSAGVDFSPTLYAQGLLDVQHRYGEVAGVVAHSLGSAAVIAALRAGLWVRRLGFLAPVRSYSAEVRKVAVSLGVDSEQLLAEVDRVLGRPTVGLDLDRYPGAGKPALFCHDVDDRRISIESSRELARSWPDGRLVETTGLGHYGILRDRSTGAELVRHLRPQ